MAIVITAQTAEDHQGFFLKGKLLSRDGIEWGQWEGGWRYQSRAGVDAALDRCRAYITIHAKLPNLCAHHSQWGELTRVH